MSRNDLDGLPIAQAARVKPHVHRRALLVQSGIRVGYWTCSESRFWDGHCPDGPDPFATLIRRIAERPVIVPEPPRRITGCDHPESRKYIVVIDGKDHGRCRDCRAEQKRRARLRHKEAA